MFVPVKCCTRMQKKKKKVPKDPATEEDALQQLQV